jgi:hypothetical protein
MATMRNWPIQLITPRKCITGNYAKKLDQESKPIHMRLKFTDNKMSSNLIRFLNNIWYNKLKLPRYAMQVPSWEDKF